MARPKNDVPSAAEFGRLRAWLATHGLTPAHLNAVLGPTPAGRSRADITALLKQWLAQRPKR
jgi:hypothetical protein